MHRYSHLLSGAASGLDCASCLHVDDIGQPVSLDPLFEEAVAFFDRIGEKPKRVGYTLSGEAKHQRSTLQKFMKTHLGGEHAVGTTLRNITITSAGFEDDAISDTWTPRAAISIARHGKVLEAFFQSSKNFGQEQQALAELPFRIAEAGFSAAYIFEYPFVFSPLAYASGLSFGPNVKQWGDHAERDSARVANWSNHCYRGHRASEGYLREVYPVNVIGFEHAKMHVGGLKLKDWIEQDSTRGSLSRFKEKMLWEIDDKNILSIQSELDKFEILLSGFPPK